MAEETYSYYLTEKGEREFLLYLKVSGNNIATMSASDKNILAIKPGPGREVGGWEVSLR